VLKSILKELGMDEERVWLRWISASEGGRFAETISQMVENLKEKGPNVLAHSWAV
jgi:F420-non-reducing hydrogenase iron-sulfur subunit